MLDILYLTQAGTTLPSVRFRVLPYVKAAKEAGAKADWFQIPKNTVNRIPFYLSLPRADVIVLQKKLVNFLELPFISRKCRKLVYDFDDAVWTSHPNVSDQAKRIRQKKKQSSRLEAVCRKADLVIAGNSFLADHVRRWGKQVEVLPTPLDTDMYVPSPHKAEGRFCVGWMGTSCNQFFLPEIMGALRPMQDKLRIKVVSDKPYMDPGGVGIEFEKWSSEEELSQLQEMDAGLMPLTDDTYTRGKCGFKLLQYMACGVVPIASDVGFNREIIENGVNGFLVNTPNEWVEAIRFLLDDSNRRQEMAVAARATVVGKFSLKAATRRLWNILSEL